MKALSGYAEWFWLMAVNLKDVENRPRPLPHALSFNLPVRIYLHGSKTKASRDEISFIKGKLAPGQLAKFNNVDWDRYRGAVIGEITIIKQIRKVRYKESDHVDIGGQQKELEILIENKDPSMSPWFFGPFGYVVKDGVLYEQPIPYIGQLGFFEVKIYNREA